MKKKILLSTILSLPAVIASAQQDASSMFNSAASEVKNTMTSAISLATAVFAIIALVGCVVVATKMVKGEREAGEKLGLWLGALAFFIIATVVIKTVFA